MKSNPQLLTNIMGASLFLAIASLAAVASLALTLWS